MIHLQGFKVYYRENGDMDVIVGNNVYGFTCAIKDNLLECAFNYVGQMARELGATGTVGFIKTDTADGFTKKYPDARLVASITLPIKQQGDHNGPQ